MSGVQGWPPVEVYTHTPGTKYKVGSYPAGQPFDNFGAAIDLKLVAPAFAQAPRRAFFTTREGVVTFTCQHGWDSQGRLITLFLNREAAAAFSSLSDLSATKHNAYLTVSVGKPERKRSTGPLSQNHAIHGYGSQMEKWLDDGTTKREIIEEAMVRAGIPYRMNRFGRQVFKHEGELSVEEAARVITELTEIARFIGCVLIEGSQEAVGGEA